MNTAPAIAELQRELAALQQRMASLEAKLSTGVGNLTCSALTVVDSFNQPVATLDVTGLLQCRSIVVGVPEEGHWLVFDPPFAELAIYGPKPTEGPMVKMVALNHLGTGGISLQAPAHSATQSIVSLSPDPDGGTIELGDNTGKIFCRIGSSSAGADCSFMSRDPQQGSVTLGVDGGGNGEIVVTDANGTIIMSLP